MYTYLHVQAGTDADDGRLLGGELTFRKVIQDALAQSFGLSGAGTYVDVLRFRSRSRPCIIDNNHTNLSTTIASISSSVGVAGGESDRCTRAKAPLTAGTGTAEEINRETAAVTVEDAVIRVACE